MAEEHVLLTKEGYDKIVADLEELTAVRRKEVAEKLKDAIAQGDISENADYDAAKNEQAELEEKINKLENMIRMAKIIDESEVDESVVGVGLKASMISRSRTWTIKRKQSTLSSEPQRQTRSRERSQTSHR